MPGGAARGAPARYDQATATGGAGSALGSTGGDAGARKVGTAPLEPTSTGPSAPETSAPEQPRATTAASAALVGRGLRKRMPHLNGCGRKGKLPASPCTSLG